MTIRKLILATTILTAASSFAFAQSGPAPANTLDNSTKAASPMGPTDNSAASASGNDMPRGSAAAGARGTGTTGAGVDVNSGRSGASPNEMEPRHVSPGSQNPANGIEKDK